MGHPMSQWPSRVPQLTGGGGAWPHSLGVVAQPLCTLGPGPAGPGAVRPGRPAAPASGNALWFLPHCDALASHTPLEREKEEMSGESPLQAEPSAP